MSNILAIAITTHRELVRSKILYSILFFAFTLVAVSSLFGRVTIGDPVKVVKDFGLLSISLFSVGFCVIAGGALLHKDLSRKTIYNILAKPVGRGEFLVGKYLGMVSTLLILVLTMGTLLSIYLYIREGFFDPGMWQAYLLIFMELSIVCGATIFFSSLVVTPLLAGVFAFSIFLAGRSSAFIFHFAEITGSPVVKGLYYILPNLGKFNISNSVVYGEVSSLAYVGYAILYAAGYSAVLLIIATSAFSRREFN